MLEPQKELSAYRWAFIPTISLPMWSRENLKSSFQKNFTSVSISMTTALWSCSSKNAGPLHRKFLARKMIKKYFSTQKASRKYFWLENRWEKNFDTKIVSKILLTRKPTKKIFFERSLARKMSHTFVNKKF